jgi:thioredoxin 1
VVDSEHILTVGDADFPGVVLEADLPALVDFWASWCGPCKAMAPVIEEFARQYAGRIKVAKLNVEENPQTPKRYGVRGIPTMILFMNGQVVDQLVGMMPIERLREMCDTAVKAT